MTALSKTAATPNKWLVLVGASLGVFNLTMNGTATITAIPAIRHEFDLAPDMLQWIVTIYFLVGAIFLAAAGRMGDAFGHGRVFLAGALSFMLAYVMIGVATDQVVILLGRALQGLAGALLLPMSLALIKDSFPDKQRQVAAGIWSGVLGLGLGVGPMVGGLLTHYLDWRQIFWVSLVIAGSAFVIILLGLRGRLGAQARDKQERQDYLGFVLLAGCMGTLTFAFTHAEDLGWNSPVTIVTLAAAVLAFAGLMFRERRVVNPFLDLRFFHHRRFVAATLGIFSTFFLIYTILVFASIFIQNSLGFAYSSAAAGLSLLSLTLVMFAASLLVHRIVAWLGHRAVVTTGMALLCVGSVLIHLEIARGSGLELEIALLICGLGLGLTVPVFSGIGTEALPKQQTGQGSGLLTTFTFLGATIGVSIGGVVSDSSSSSVLADGLAGLQITQPPQIAEIEAGLHTTAANLSSLLDQFDGPTARGVHDALQRAVDAGFADLTLLCAIVAGLGAVAQNLLLRPARN